MGWVQLGYQWRQIPSELQICPLHRPILWFSPSWVCSRSYRTFVSMRHSPSFGIDPYSHYTRTESPNGELQEEAHDLFVLLWPSSVQDSSSRVHPKCKRSQAPPVVRSRHVRPRQAAIHEASPPPCIIYFHVSHAHKLFIRFYKAVCKILLWIGGERQRRYWILMSGRFHV